jgi:hypothetical protein
VLGAKKIPGGVAGIDCGETGAAALSRRVEGIDEQKAERLVKDMLTQARCTEADLKRRRKGDRKKARMAARLRAAWE